jgi:hypothetical protein
MLHLARGETIRRSTTDHGHEGHDQTADTQNHATEQVAVITDAARPAGHRRQVRGQTPNNAAEEPRSHHSRRSQGWRRHTSQGKKSLLQSRNDALPFWDDRPTAWLPQPGEVLAGVSERYTISDTP